MSAARFSRRVLIGRRPFNGVRIDDPAVSRLHAWIGRDGDGFYVQDAGSRSGTRLNGQGIIEPARLVEGSQIQIGSSTLVFHETDDLPPDATPFEISENGTNLEYQDDGFLLECRCGAALWMPARRGVHGSCSRCGEDIEESARVIRPQTPRDAIAHHVPSPVVLSEAQIGQLPHPHPQAADALCSVCQSPIAAGEAVERCPACGQTYHAECWAENRGCASYGCAQVGALEPVESVGIIESPESLLEGEIESHRFPWDFALLGGSVLGTVLGAVTFGIPAAVVGLISAVYAARNRRKPIAMFSTVICVIGTAAGVLTSRAWWFGGSIWPIVR